MAGKWDVMVSEGLKWKDHNVMTFSGQDNLQNDMHCL